MAARVVLEMMRERPPDLPDYERPPIDEVAIDLQFETLLNMTTDQIRSYWEKVRTDEYPRQEVQPRIETAIETFQNNPFGGAQIQFVDRDPTCVIGLLVPMTMS